MIARIKRWLRGAGGPAPPIACRFCGETSRYCGWCGSHQHDSAYHHVMAREEERMASAGTGKP